MLITLNDLQNADDFKSFATSIIDYDNPRLQIFTNEYAYYLSTKNYAALKAEFVREPLTQEQWYLGIEYKNTLSFTENVRLFVGSRKSFFTEFGFYNYPPSVIYVLLSIFEKTNSIKKFGTGYGSAILVDTKNISVSQFLLDEILNSISVLATNSKDSIPQRFLSSQEIIVEELEFYKNLQILNNNKISTLHTQIIELQNQNYINSQLTWR
jgi:hypothetical protein